MSQWLAALPPGWVESRLDRVATAWPSNVDKHSVAGQVPVRLCNYTDVYKNASITEDLSFMTATATDEQVARFRVALGDTLITKDSETADDIGIPAFVEYEASDLVCGYHLAVVRPDPTRVHPRYLYWAMASQPILRQWAVLASGVTRVGIRSRDLARVALPLPPLDVQRAISAYLDHETAKIDTLIAKQEQLIVTLRERRRAVHDVIASTASGKVRRLRYLFVPSSEADHPTEPVLSVYRDFGVIPKSSRADNFNRTPQSVARYLLVRQGDLVVNRMKAWQGSLGVSDHRGIVSGDYEVARPQTEELLPRFAHLYLRSSRMIAEYAIRSTGIRPSQWRLYWGQMGDIEMPVPSYQRQHAVVSEIDEQTAKIEALIAKTERFIELSKERRTALIAAAVTGQLDVGVVGSPRPL